MHRENNCFFKNTIHVGSHGRHVDDVCMWSFCNITCSGKIGRIPVPHVKDMKRNQIKPLKKMAAAVV